MTMAKTRNARRVAKLGKLLHTYIRSSLSVGITARRRVFRLFALAIFLFIQLALVAFFLHPNRLALHWWPKHSKSTAPRDHSTMVVAMVSTVKSAANLGEYKLGLATQQCYAGLQNYAHHLLYMEHHDVPPESPWERTMIDKCVPQRFANGRPVDFFSAHQMFFFSRQCALAELLSAHPEYNYVLYADGDVGVINPQRRIEEFITDSEPNLIFYERQFDMEIMAGSFLAKNTPQTRQFLVYWSNYVWEMARLTNNSAHDSFAFIATINVDQGPLHVLFMEMFATEAEKKKCDGLFPRRSKYENYVACARHYLAGHVVKRGVDGSHYFYNETFGLVKVLPKYGSFARDQTMLITEKWSEDVDFMVHGWKEHYGDLPHAERVKKPDMFGYYWTRPLVGEEPFDHSQCSTRNKDEVVQRYWRDRWRKELLISGGELKTIFADRKQSVEREFDRVVQSLHLQDV